MFPKPALTDNQGRNSETNSTRVAAPVTRSAGVHLAGSRRNAIGAGAACP